MLGDPDAFDEQPTHADVGASWNSDAWDSIFEDGEGEED
jgi:hypothetical protein